MVVSRPVVRIYNLLNVKRLIDTKRVDLEAPYQRDVVWGVGKMGMLIDSILKNFYVPPVIMVSRRRPEGDLVNVCIDGKQRLTSVHRFMNNEIPYMDDSYDPPRKTFYEHMNGDPEGRAYLTDPQREVFDMYEINFTTYSDISEDDELEIFARVQLGTALTSSERLAATNSPMSILCSSLVTDYNELLRAIHKKKRADNFMVIAQLMIQIHDNASEYTATPTKLTAFLGNQMREPTNVLKSTLHAILGTFREMYAAPGGEDAFKKVVNPTTQLSRSQQLRGMEMVIFGVFLSLLRKPPHVVPSTPDLIELLIDLRGEIYYRHGVVKTGGPCFTVGMLWINSKLAAMPPSPISNASVTARIQAADTPSSSVAHNRTSVSSISDHVDLTDDASQAIFGMTRSPVSPPTPYTGSIHANHHDTYTDTTHAHLHSYPSQQKLYQSYQPQQQPLVPQPIDQYEPPVYAQFVPAPSTMPTMPVPYTSQAEATSSRQYDAQERTNNYASSSTAHHTSSSATTVPAGSKRRRQDSSSSTRGRNMARRGGAVPRGHTRQ